MSLRSCLSALFLQLVLLSCARGSSLQVGDPRIRISTGFFHTCFHSTINEKLRCYGDNYFGQLGLGLNPGTKDVPSPFATVGDTSSELNSYFVSLSNSSYEVLDIAAGGYHTCVHIRGHETGVKCFGSNSRQWGQLGLGVESSRVIGRHKAEMGENLKTVNMGTTAAIRKLVSGYAHTCVLLENHKVSCWGWNNYGQLGAGDRNNALIPATIPEFLFSDISLGKSHTCGILKSQELLCWGNNDCGQVGVGEVGIHATPVTIEIPSLRVIEVSAGGSHTCVITLDRVLKCWGNNLYGQIGTGTNQTKVLANESIPIVFGDHRNVGVVHVAAGEDHTCALLATGDVYCWGLNNDGQLGVGNLEKHAEPILVQLNGKASQVVAGRKHSCAVLLDSKIECWGSNRHAQLALGDKIDRLSPTEIPLSLFS